MNKKLYLLFALPLLAWSAASLAFGPYYQPPYQPVPHQGIAAAQRHMISGGVSLNKSQTPTTYVLQVRLRQIPAADIQIDRQGRNLLISSQREQHSDQSQAGGRYWMQSSMARFNYRVTVPPDADMENMKRTDGDNLITVELPKLR